MDPLLLGTAAAFGLAASTGLNTTLPLLIVGLLARFGLIELNAPYDALSSNVALAGLVLVSAVEFIGDKLPALDSVMHAVQWPLAATAGAILFASQTSVISWLSPGLAIIVGLLVAGSVHSARMAFRPVVTASTFGLGNTATSTAEDAAAVTLAGASVLAPLLGLVLLLALVAVLVLAGSWAVRHGVRLSRWARG